MDSRGTVHASHSAGLERERKEEELEEEQENT
jgi:hypothetical protein